MKSHDEDRIDAVLRALGEGEPAVGMQERISAALRRAEQASDSEARGWLPGLMGFPRGMALRGLAVAAMVVASTAVVLHVRHRARPVDGHGPGLAVVHQHGPGVRGKRSDGVVLPAHATSKVPVDLASAGKRAQATPAPEGVTEERSFPAPPLPLTEQERLLIRLIHHEAPIQLAQLTTPVIDAARQREADEVAAFFAPRPPVAEEELEPAETPRDGDADPVPLPTNAATKEIQ